MIEEIRTLILGDRSYGKFIFFPDFQIDRPFPVGLSMLQSTILAKQKTQDPKDHIWRINSIVGGLYRDPWASKVALKIFDPRTIPGRNVSEGSDGIGLDVIELLEEIEGIDGVNALVWSDPECFSHFHQAYAFSTRPTQRLYILTMSCAMLIRKLSK